MTGTREDSRTEATAPGRAHQPSGRRLLWGLLLSLPVNLVVWGLAAGVFRSPVPALPAPAAPFLVQRIVLASPQVPAKMSSKQIARPAPHPKIATPKPLHSVRQPTVPRRTVSPKHAAAKQVQPRGAARPQPPRPPSTRAAASLPLITTPGAATAENIAPNERNPSPGMKPETPAETSAQTRSPTPAAGTAPPRTADAPPAPTPVAHEAAPPLPAGPTREAQPLTIVKPEIPDELREGDYQSTVRFTVQIDAEGHVTGVTLRDSSGNRELDRRIVEALKRWRWRPAVQDGKPIPDTRLYRFQFEVS